MDFRGRQEIVPSWRAELRFLLAHVGAGRFAADADGPGDGFNWEFLLETASLQGVLPIFLRSVSNHATKAMPAAVLARANHECNLVAKRNFIFAHELSRILDRLENRGIGVVPYKGPPLAQMAYGDVSLRQFSDLDILVKGSDLFSARHVLEEHGYHARFIYAHRPMSSLTAAETAAFVRNLSEFEMQRKDGLLIDLHWQLAPRLYPFRLDPDPLWDRLVTIRVAGRSMRCFAREDLVLVLCLHGAKDLWRKLIWISDLARVVMTDGALDWDAVLSRARDARMDYPLELGLRLIEELYGVDPPVRAGARRGDRIDGLARQVFARLFSTSGRPDRGPVSALHVGLCRGPADKLTYTMGALFVPRVADWAIVRLPPFLSPLYFVVRPLRIFAVSIRNAVYRLLGKAAAKPR